MKTQPVSGDLLGKVIQALSTHPVLRSVDARAVSEIARQGLLVHYMAGEQVHQQEEPAETFGFLLRGNLSVKVQPQAMPEVFEIDRLRPVVMFGEVEALTGVLRRYSVHAVDQVLVLQVDSTVLLDSISQSPALAVALAQDMAMRLTAEQRKVPLPYYDVSANPPNAQVVALLPQQFMERQRVLPLMTEGNRIYLGFVDDLTALTFGTARSFLPGAELVPLRIDNAGFNTVLQTMVTVDAGAAALQSGSHSSMMSGEYAAAAPYVGSAASQANAAVAAAPTAVSPATRPARPEGSESLSAPKLDPLLRRMVAEGASDLHLSAGYRPRWRIDGEMREIADIKVLSDMTVWDIIEPGMPPRNKRQFLEENDTDFAYALTGTARFRVNMFRDQNGIGAVLRVIPSKILTFEQLGLPEGVRKMCDNPKGLVLVTGPTGSGKSTTLAAMIDYINRTRRQHVITLEDPIEFEHKSLKSLVNQREVGPHTQSFARALRAALREDPDIVLVGEMRDKETIQLAIETANTGHLVFGTLHTSTAISTVDRIIDVFPPEQQGQVRTVVAEVLKGVVSQTLLRRKGGGRVAALEVLVGSHAVANLIREGKNHQIFNIMLTQKQQGNQLLNDQLEQLVRDGRTEYDEAIMKALDKPEFAKRFGKEYFEK